MASVRLQIALGRRGDAGVRCGGAVLATDESPML